MFGDFHEAQVFLFGESAARLGGKPGAAMASTKSLAISAAASRSITWLTPMTPPKADTGIALQGAHVGFAESGSGSGAAGVGVLDDGADGLGEFLREVPRGL